ncbi:MAG: ribosome small subunit-dependent GTPase A [Gammaproteobacteria bacterium]|nr:MAG: ribosome small subunit-dependent GTPase A [Gammaproteobacteria bacterium]
MTNQYSLSQLGWNHFFQQQLTLEEWEDLIPARVVEQQRSEVTLLSTIGSITLKTVKAMPPLVVGDWLLIDQNYHFYRLLERSSLFHRKASGAKIDSQLIAANVDTLFIVSSLNQDFNLNRIERYLSLASETAVEPIIVLTKLDCCNNHSSYIEQINEIDSMLNVIAINALDQNSVSQLAPWCCPGKTVALLGSSGVGKSTLLNTLTGASNQKTNSIREDDSKGRHTTTSRSIHLLSSGGLILDTPGMRELQLFDCEQGVETVFADIADLASQCRFSDCNHNDEPGCAVRLAIEQGAIDERRLINYLKLKREQEFNSASLAEKRAKDREFGRHVRLVMKEKQREKNHS